MIEATTTVQLRFGKRLREIRRSFSISQEQLANRAELDRTYISLLERGLRNPTLNCIEKLAKALDVPISELFMFEVESWKLEEFCNRFFFYQKLDMGGRRICR